MSEPKIVQKFPYKISIESDKSYYWCSCGLSSKQPFCDGSHKRLQTGITPIKFVAEKETNYM